MSRRDRIEAALIGAYVADAAALGFHWLYDPARIAALADDAPAFREPNPENFEGYKGVFVHFDKRAGDLSQYGAQLRVAVQTMIAGGGRFDVAEFQARFAAAFGAGGSWIGYMDKATKGTLANLAAGQTDPSGADDDQVPAIAKLPALMMDASVTDDEVAAAVATTNANKTAADWSPVAAEMLRAAYAGASPAEAAKIAASSATGEIANALNAAMSTSENDTVAFAGEVGRACPLPQSMPVIAHVAVRATSYRDAVDRNILAGGDNCGRAPVLGAIFGAAFGLGGQGVPLQWIGRLDDIARLTDEASVLEKKFV